MTIYEYKPEKNTKRVFGLIIIFISLAAALFFTPIAVPTMSFRWLFQFLGIISIITVIYLLTRYIAKSFVYAVIDDEGQLDFTVTELTNGARRSTTVCRISIANISEIQQFDMNDAEQKIREKEMVARARGEHRKCYDYCHDIKTSPVCVLLVEECGDPLLIKIAGDDKLFALLSAKQ